MVQGKYEFDANVKALLPLLTKAGKIAVRQAKIKKKPLAYWKAQCGFRNLTQSGTIATLQNRLRDTYSNPDPPEAVKHAAREPVKDEKSYRNQQQKTVSEAKKARNDTWDVTGSWKISCPYMEEQWGNEELHCSLHIHFTRNKGVAQMWASFDFIAITGVFRFVNPAFVGKALAPATQSHEGEEDEYRDFEEEEVHEFAQTPTPEEFNLGVNDKPSPSCPNWSYRWRGEETGENVIELYSDKNLCSVTFGGEGGIELSGVFDSDLGGKVKFTGRKSITVVPSNCRQWNISCGSNVNYEWNKRSERAYERARTGRWR